MTLDLETNSLKNPSVIHCIVARDIDEGETYEFVGREIFEEFPNFIRRCRLVVGHNCIAFDLPVLRKLVGVSIDPALVQDTLVIARTLEIRVEGGHSLEAWGERLGIQKVGVGITDWSEFTPQMLERCLSDAEINAKLYEHLLLKARFDYCDRFREAIRVEHEIAWICVEMHENGFGFDIEKAKALYEEIETKVQEIDKVLAEAFPPKVEKIQLKTKVKEIVTPFNPGSPKQIVERLSPYWKPTEFTEKGNPRVCEENLATLKADAPEAAQKLVMRQMLASRLRTLTQWFEAYNETTGRIHATFNGLGTWTHRFTHTNPNLGNVAAPKSIKYRGEVLAELAKSYGGRMRELWRVDPREEDDTWLVGTDAEGIQLRIFAHYVGDQEFIQAVTQGRKDDATDPHSLNARILQTTRESAKTWIYAFLLGAGNRKLGEILGRSSGEGGKAKDRFIAAIPGLKRLKQKDIKRDAERGYIEGFDGRLIKVPSEHTVMAAYLQAGEAIIVKYATVEARRRIREEGLSAKIVNMVHDEIIFEVRTNEGAERVKTIVEESIGWAGEKFKLQCPMKGQGLVGKNWLEVH